MKNELTLAAMLEELERIINADLTRLSMIFGSDAESILRSTPVDEMPVTKNMRQLYDYVVNARLSTSFPLSDVLHEVTDYFLETVPHSPMLDLYAETRIEGLCAWIVDTAVVRWGVDFEEIGLFTIKQIATLANMDEKSVRNAANPKNPDALKTFRDVDGSTKVTRDDAIAWLKGRRSYKPTVFMDDSGERDLERDGFKDLVDLAEFVARECQRKDKTLSKVLKAAGLEEEHANWTDQNRSELMPFSAEDVQRLAAGIEVDARVFTLAALKAHQKAELDLLDARLKS